MEYYTLIKRTNYYYIQSEENSLIMRKYGRHRRIHAVWLCFMIFREKQNKMWWHILEQRISEGVWEGKGHEGVFWNQKCVVSWYAWKLTVHIFDILSD